MQMSKLVESNDAVSKDGCIDADAALARRSNSGNPISSQDGAVRALANHDVDGTDPAAVSPPRTIVITRNGHQACQQHQGVQHAFA